MSFKYLQLAFNDDCMIELYYKGFSSQVAISNNQRSCKIKIISKIYLELRA